MQTKSSFSTKALRFYLHRYNVIYVTNEAKLSLKCDPQIIYLNLETKHWSCCILQSRQLRISTLPFLEPKIDLSLDMVLFFILT